MEEMNRHAPYVDASANRYAAAQSMQQMSHRMQQNAQMNDFSRHPHSGSRAEQWDTNPQIELNPMSPHSYSQDYRGHASKSFSQERAADQKANYENQTNNPTRLQSYEEDMEIGYEDNKAPESSSTLEGLEHKFQDEIMNLIKELSDAEDAENGRHRERIVEINTRYQENLSSLRAQHTARVGEFLRKESQARVQQYRQAEMGTHPTMSPRDYGWSTAAEAPRMHPAAQYPGARRSQDPEVRVPYPHGRVYNNSSARFY